MSERAFGGDGTGTEFSLVDKVGGEGISGCHRLGKGVVIFKNLDRQVWLACPGSEKWDRRVGEPGQILESLTCLSKILVFTI